MTTLPAPITEYFPIELPALIVLFAPMEAPFLIFVFTDFSGYCFDLGTKSLVKVTFGPIKTSSSMVIPFHICTPDFTVIFDPNTTSSSIKT